MFTNNLTLLPDSFSKSYIYDMGFKKNASYLFGDCSEETKILFEETASKIGYTSLQSFLIEAAYLFFYYPSLFPEIKKGSRGKTIYNHISFHSKKHSFVANKFNELACIRDIPTKHLFNEFIQRLELLLKKNVFLPLPKSCKIYLKNEPDIYNLRKHRAVLAYFNLVKLYNENSSTLQLSYSELNDLLNIGISGYDKQHIKQYTSFALRHIKKYITFEVHFKYFDSFVILKFKKI